MEQLTLFELMQQVSDFPCDDCVFDVHGCCSHIENEECFCVMGSFQIKNSAIICPACGHTMDVVQMEFGSDGAQCNCGIRKIFNNKGNRMSAFELWKLGRLVGK